MKDAWQRHTQELEKQKEEFAEIDVDNYLEYVYGDPMIGMILVMNSMFVFMLPSGVGLYYLTSGMFSAVEQLVYYMIKLKINKKDNYNAA